MMMWMFPVYLWIPVCTLPRQGFARQDQVTPDVPLPALSAPNFSKCNLGWSILGHLEGWKAGKQGRAGRQTPDWGTSGVDLPQLHVLALSNPNFQRLLPGGSSSNLVVLFVVVVRTLATVLYSINSWLPAQVAWKIIRPTSKVPAIRFFAPHLQQTSYSDYYSRRLDLKCLKLTGCLLA